MSVIITSAGEAHLVALANPGTVPGQFNAATLSRGSAELTVSDTVGSMLRPFLQVGIKEGYPRRNDLDPRNGGRGGDRWTWAFDIEPGEAFCATNLGVHEFGAGPAGTVIIHSNETLEKRSTERMTIFVNARAGGPATVVAVTEEVYVEPARAIWSPRAKHLALAVSGLSAGAARALVRPGEEVRVMALMPNDVGGVLTRAETRGAELFVYRRSRVGTWEQIDDRILDTAEDEGVFNALVTDDQRWPHPGGYNVAANWRVPPEERALAYAIEVRARSLDDRLRSETWELDVHLPHVSMRR